LPYDADDDSEDATTMLLSFEEGLLINTDCS
jgi:hypothetical protein